MSTWIALRGNCKFFSNVVRQCPLEQIYMMSLPCVYSRRKCLCYIKMFYTRIPWWLFACCCGQAKSHDVTTRVLARRALQSGQWEIQGNDKLFSSAVCQCPLQQIYKMSLRYVYSRTKRLYYIKMFYIRIPWWLFACCCSQAKSRDVTTWVLARRALQSGQWDADA